MDAKAFKRTVAEGDYVAGVFVRIPSIEVIEIMGNHPVDFAVLDAEHNPFSLETVSELILACRSQGIAPLFRPPSNRHIHDMRRALDSGAAGVMIPHVESAEVLEECIEALKFAPEGRRGVCGNTRAGNWGTGAGSTDPNRNTALEEQNETTAVFGLVESERGVENVDEILASGLLDCVLIGSADLSQSLVNAYDLHHPEVEAAEAEVLAAAREHSVPVGGLAYSPEEAHERADQGATVMMNTDVHLLNSALERDLIDPAELEHDG